MISQNPLRLLGVLSTDSLKEIKKNQQKASAFFTLKKDPVFNYDSDFFGSSVVRNKELMLDAYRLIQLDLDKLKYSIFWISSISQFDTIAIKQITLGNFEKVIELFEKQVAKENITKSNYSAYVNLSTLLYAQVETLINKKKPYSHILSRAIELKCKFLESKYFNDYCHKVVNTNFSCDQEAILNYFFEQNISFFKKVGIKDNKIQEVIAATGSFKEHFNRKLSETIIKSINDQISKAKELTSKNEKKGGEYGRALMKNTKKDVQNLKSIDKGSIDFQMLVDKLALQLEQCGIFYHNSTRDDFDYLDVYEYALKIAHGPTAKSRLKKAINHCKELNELSKCCLCKVNSVNRSRPKEYLLYRETSRNRWYEQRSVKFQQLTVTIYFCNKCLDEIKKVDQLNQIIWLVLAIIIGLSLGFTVHWIVGIIAGLVGGAILTNILSFFIPYLESSIKKVDSHPTIKKYISEGWGWNKPEA